jgi:hypothetical protein
VKDGQPAGTPVFVQYGNIDSGYTTKGVRSSTLLSNPAVLWRGIFSPDGRKLIVASWNNVNGFELWSLENFVPAAPKN